MNKVEIIYNEYIEKYVAIISDEDDCVDSYMQNLDKAEVEGFLNKLKSSYPNIEVQRYD